MRKVLLSLLAGLAITVGSGCLKDKDFEDQKYGIQIKETKGVSFPEALGSPLVIGINSQAAPQEVSGPLLTLDESGAPSADVKVTLQINSGLVTDLGFTPLGPTEFSVNSLVVTIPAGTKLSDAVKVTVSNSSLLDPLVVYGVGLTISSVDQGYKVAQNMKDIVIAFNIKNQYDGKYTLKGKFYHPSYPYFPISTTVEMHTSGPNSVKMYWPPFDDYLNPFSTSATGTPLTGFDGQDPDFTVNSTTNSITVQNVSAGAVTFYGMGLGFDNAGYTSRWDPATKTMYACYGYNLGAGGSFVAGSTRMWIDTLVYTGPR